MSDAYLTIERSAQCELKVKGSRFIGETFLAADSQSAQARLAEVRKREHAASHHCYAYITGLGQAQVFKYSDDGEPSGSAGRPIYDVVAGCEVTNVLCVVTRYFGGTKLGTGGLVRAYGDAAREAMQRSGSLEHFLCTDFRLTFEFSIYDRLAKQLRTIGASVIDSQFADLVTLRVQIRNSLAERLASGYRELTAGKGKIEQIAGE